MKAGLMRATWAASDRASNASDVASTWSSCAPRGKVSNSSTYSAFQSPRTIFTTRRSQAAENGAARVALSPVGRRALAAYPRRTLFR